MKTKSDKIKFTVDTNKAIIFIFSIFLIDIEKVEIINTPNKGIKSKLISIII